MPRVANDPCRSSIRWRVHAEPSRMTRNPNRSIHSVDMRLEHQGIADSRLEQFSRALVSWFDPDRRPFPWRNSDSLYYVTICEVLLQRTNAEKVAIATGKLFGTFPEPGDLAHAPTDTLVRLLKPLGLPHRIEQVRQIAATFALAQEERRQVTIDTLSRLPGVGPYCLAAARVLALNERAALIDEHVLRVFRRVFSVHAPSRRHPTQTLRDFAVRLVPASQAKVYSLAILDLGRLVCRPRSPKMLGMPHPVHV